MKSNIFALLCTCIVDPKGQKALEMLFAWFVAMTKEQSKFHIILCSSDSFMFNWLANFVGNDRFKVYPIGHLSKEEAERFWEERVCVDGFDNCEKLSFEEMFNITGGNMFLMRMMYIDYRLAGIRPDESIYLQMINKFIVFFVHEPPYQAIVCCNAIFQHNSLHKDHRTAFHADLGSITLVFVFNCN